jgi:thiopeptide-type bacteriocin biosynthesis protein
MLSYDRVDDRGLKPETGPIGGKWLSFHLYLPGPPDLFLTEHLHPSLVGELASQQICRFFFIRYSEGGLHLRLRFLPGRSGDPVVIEQWFNNTVRDFAGSLPAPALCRLERRAYNREEHYFGETVYSVYAELLNEQTSWLALRLLSGYWNRPPQLLLLLAACLRFFLLRTTANPGDYIAVVELSRSFAADLVVKMGLSADMPTEKEQAAFDALVPQVLCGSISFLSHDHAVTAIIRLMRRACKIGQQGQFVATHALHLFCNKLGFSVQEEYRIFALLKGQ